MAETKSNHRVNVVRIAEIRKHGNADSLGLIDIEGYQVVVKLGEYQPGDLAVYVQPDSVVPETAPFAFLWEGVESPVPERKRRITVRKFRGEWSEGLLMPYSDFFGGEQPNELAEGFRKRNKRYPTEGDDVSELLDITHYQPPEPGEQSLPGRHSSRQNRKWPRSLKGWLYFIAYNLGLGDKYQRKLNGLNSGAPENMPPVYDVEALKNHKNVFVSGEQVVVTEKIHGSNARYVFDGKKMFAGSRQLWKSEISGCVWRQALRDNPWIESWCRANPGWTLYGEVVPTQGGYTYGTKPNEAKFFLFDALSPDDKWIDIRSDEMPDRWLSADNNHYVPLLYQGPYDEAVIRGLVDGPSTVAGAKHIREGVVIRANPPRRAHGLGLVQLKLVSNAFLLKDSAKKEAA